MSFELTEQEKKILLALARETITAKLESRSPRLPAEEEITGNLKIQTGAFVTLHSQGHLRGCIGIMTSDDPLWETIKDMALSAAFRDPRFPALEKGELDIIDLEISVLTPFIPISSTSEIKIGTHGVYLKHHHRSGVFLPQVPVEQNWNLKEYLTHLSLKAGLPGNGWKAPESELFTFSALVFGEKKT